MAHRLLQFCSITALAAITATALAGTVIWTYSEDSGGEDVEWWSDTTCETDANRYVWTNDIDRVLVDIEWSGIPFNVDVTDMIPEEDLHQEDIHEGGLPFVIGDVSFQIDVDGNIEIDAAADIYTVVNEKGRGHMQVTNVFLGDAWIYLPWPFEWQLVQINRVYLEGSITVVEEYATCESDINDDDVVNVSDLLAVIAAWGPCSGSCPEDIDGDGSVNVSDLLAVIAAWGPCV